LQILVFIGNFVPPAFSAKQRVLKLIPQISKRIVPFATRAPQCEKGPLPLPIRTPVDLEVIGKSGKIFIQI
jgi:hypothetical protein